MQYIVDNIGDVIAKMETPPHYIYDTPKNINIRLKKENEAANKYPLIALKLEIEEDHVANGFVWYDLNLVFVNYSEQSQTTEQRFANVIKPILVPLYKEFLRALKTVGRFQWEGDRSRPPHKMIIRPNWGTTGKKERVMDDPLDAIEIFNLRINQRYKLCK